MGWCTEMAAICVTLFIFCSAIVLAAHNIDGIYIQDGALSPLGFLLKKIYKKPVLVTVHGLDITFSNKLYQKIVPFTMNKLDRVVCISNATKQECIKRGISNQKIVVIPDGITDEFYTGEDRDMLKTRFGKKIKKDLRGKKILLSVGRLVERKGYHWFIKNVIPRLIMKKNNILYLIVGDGKYYDKIKLTIKESHLENYVVMLGKVNFETLKILYNISDVLAMPNVPVSGDMEGFGIVALEATSCGIPVVSSDLEGIKDAVINEKNGFLVDPLNSKAFSEVIMNLLVKRNISKESIRDFSLKRFHWKEISLRYISEFKAFKMYSNLRSLS